MFPKAFLFLKRYCLISNDGFFPYYWVRGVFTVIFLHLLRDLDGGLVEDMKHSWPPLNLNLWSQWCLSLCKCVAIFSVQAKQNCLSVPHVLYGLLWSRGGHGSLIIILETLSQLACYEQTVTKNVLWLATKTIWDGSGSTTYTWVCPALPVIRDGCQLLITLLD